MGCFDVSLDFHHIFYIAFQWPPRWPMLGLYGVLKRTVIIRQTLPIWQASAWILERRYRNEWGRHKKPVDNQGAESKHKALLSLDEKES